MGDRGQVRTTVGDRGRVRTTVGDRGRVRTTVVYQREFKFGTGGRRWGGM